MKESSDWNLNEILRPHGWEAFVAKYWQKRPLHIHREDRSFFSGLVSRQDVEFVINTYGGREDFPISIIGAHINTMVPMEDRGSRRTHWLPEKVYERVGKGATVRIGNVAQYLPPVRRLAASFEAFLNTDIGVNLYCTPPSSQAFGAHFDNHDVFILQVEGSKVWKIFRPPQDLPAEVFYKARPSWWERKLPFEVSLGPSRPAVEPDQEIVLSAGDLLYVPRGFVHQVFTSRETSLHLTVAAPVVTWYEVVVQSLIEACRQSRPLREALPPGFAASPANTPEMRDRMTEVISAVRQTVTEDKLANALEELALRYVNSRHDSWPGIETSVDLGNGLTGDTVLEIRPSLVYKTWKEIPYIYLLFAGRGLRIPVRCESMLDYILEKRRFRVADLPTTMNDESRLTLARAMFERGFLEQVRSGR